MSSKPRDRMHLLDFQAEYKVYTALGGLTYFGINLDRYILLIDLHGGQPTTDSEVGK